MEQTSQNNNENTIILPGGQGTLAQEPTEKPKTTRNPVLPGSTRLSRAEITNKTDQLSEDRQLPNIPGKNLQEAEARPWFNLLTIPMWGRIMVYCYRLSPVINRKLSDPTQANYIDIINKDNLDSIGNGDIRTYLKNCWGGGRYKLTVNDTDKNKNATMFDAFITIPFDEAEPKIEYKELVIEDRANLSYVAQLQQRGILDSQKRLIVSPTPQQAQQQQQNQTSDAAINAVVAMNDKMIQLFQSFSREQKQELGKGGINELLLEKMKQDDPNKQMVVMQGMLEAFAKMIPKPAEQPKPEFSIKDILQMQQSSNDKIMEIMGKFMEVANKPPPPPPPVRSLMDQIEEFKAIKEMFGVGGPATGEAVQPTTAQVIMEGAKEFLLPVLGIASQFMQQKTGRAPIVPVTEQQAQDLVNGNGGGGRQPNGANPMGQPQGQLPPPPPNNVVSIQGQQQPTTPEDKGLFMLQEYINVYGGLIVNAMKSGVSGVDVGERISALTEMVNQNIYGIIQAQGDEKLLIAMKSIPEFWAATGGLYGEEKMVKFIDEFMNFEKYIQEEENQEGN